MVVENGFASVFTEHWDELVVFMVEEISFTRDDTLFVVGPKGPIQNYFWTYSVAISALIDYAVFKPRWSNARNLLAHELRQSDCRSHRLRIFRYSRV